MIGIDTLAAAANENGQETIWLVVGLIAVGLLVWGLVKRLVKVAVIFGIIAAAAWFLYFA